MLWTFSIQVGEKVRQLESCQNTSLWNLFYFILFYFILFFFCDCYDMYLEQADAWVWLCVLVRVGWWCLRDAVLPPFFAWFSFTFWLILFSIRQNIQKSSLLRAVCLKVGIQIYTKDYNFNSDIIFHVTDVANLFPVMKHVDPRVTLISQPDIPLTQLESRRKWAPWNWKALPSNWPSRLGISVVHRIIGYLPSSLWAHASRHCWLLHVGSSCLRVLSSTCGRCFLEVNFIKESCRSFISSRGCCPSSHTSNESCDHQRTSAWFRS